MLPHSNSRFTRAALITFFIAIILYGLYEAQGILFGPKIHVSTETTVVHEPYVKIEGRADRIVGLSMNGKQIPVTEDGAFSEPFLLARGQNRVSLQAKDSYGRTATNNIDIMYIPAIDVSSTSATSSGQTSTQ